MPIDFEEDVKTPHISEMLILCVVVGCFLIICSSFMVCFVLQWILTTAYIIGDLFISLFTNFLFIIWFNDISLVSGICKTVFLHSD